MSRLRAREIYRDSRLTLLAVESVEIQRGGSDAYFYVRANVQPIAVVVHTPEELYALDTEALPMDFEQLVEAVPELASLGDGP